MMAGVGVAHMLLKKQNKKKITIQIFDKATSVKTIQHSGTGIPSHVPAQTYTLPHFNANVVNRLLHENRKSIPDVFNG